MTAFLWLIASVLSLWSAAYLVSATVASLRALRPGLAAVAALLVTLGVAVFGLRNVFVVLLAAAFTGWAAIRILRLTTRNPQHASQTTKLSAAHIALLAGSFMFLIPFAWLLSTSLKTDEEQAIFPPVWIPTQQVTTPLVKGADGKPAKLSIHGPAATAAAATEAEIKAATVVELADLPSGDVRVRPLAGGAEFTAKRAELKKIREVSPRWENYSEALEYLPPDSLYGLVFLKNTLLLTFLTTLGTVISSSLVAYSFARLRWPGRNFLFGVLLATMMIPGAVTMMPQFLIYRNLGWIDTLKPLWVGSFFGSAFNIFLLRQFFMSIPTELEDAAKLDGCGPFAVYWRVMLPMVKPALAAIAIMSVLGAWNNFQGPLIYLSSPENMPLAYALQLYQQQHSSEPGLLMAASTLVVLPIIVLFFFTQRYFIEGVSLTGLGGR
jgi:multiple sugar transport system permease protein